MPQMVLKSNCFLLSQGWKFVESWFAVGFGLALDLGKNTLANEISAQMCTILHDMKLHIQI